MVVVWGGDWCEAARNSCRHVHRSLGVCRQDTRALRHSQRRHLRMRHEQDDQHGGA